MTIEGIISESVPQTTMMAPTAAPIPVSRAVPFMPRF
jgi:hypothetical protein